MKIYSFNFFKYKNIKIGFKSFYSKNKIFIITSCFILLYVSLYFLIDFSTQSLVAHDEGLYARRSRLIESSDNWFSPPFDSPHHKTLGSYWFIALTLKLLGNSELAIRLPSILSSFLCLISSYFIALKVTNKKAALISLFSLSSIPLWIQYSRYASPDFPFVLCILLGILFFLKSLKSLEYPSQYIYIFLSGLFLSTSFFIRSYMTFIPLIGLAPFFSYNLYKKDSIFKISFFSGLIIGSIPTVLNFYFSFKKFGYIGITSFFEFAKKQAVGEFDFTKLIFFPLKFLYLTFPVGILLIILFVFTRPNNKIEYPLLVYFYPLISLILLLCMSTSYPHYYLFLLPSLSIILANYLTSISFKYSFSSFYIKLLLILTLLFISSIFLFFIINHNDLITTHAYGNRLIVYIPSSILLVSYVRSIIYLFDVSSFGSNLIKFFHNIFIYQYLSLSLFFNFGVLGNPNYNTKLFLKDELVASIINSNTIYLFCVESKAQTLLSFYLPYSKIITDHKEINKYKYIITSDNNFLQGFKNKTLFIPVNKFDNHVLFKNISI